jgi:hypothetical protein
VPGLPPRPRLLRQVPFSFTFFIFIFLFKIINSILINWFIH